MTQATKNTASQNLSKNVIPSLLSDRLGCPIETLNFLFSARNIGTDDTADVLIPDSRVMLQDDQASLSVSSC